MVLAVSIAQTARHSGHPAIRFKRDAAAAALLAESIARFGWEKLVAQAIGDSDHAPVARLWLNQDKRP